MNLQEYFNYKNGKFKEHEEIDDLEEGDTMIDEIEKN